MQLELENSKRENDRLQTMVDDLPVRCTTTAPMVQQPSYFPPLGSNLLGSNLGVNRMPAPPPAEPVPVARPQAPSFAPGLDVQLAMINSHHDSNKFRKLG